MAMAASVRRFLERSRVSYRILEHHRTGSLEQAAATALIPHERVARAVMLRDERGVLMAVLPLNHLLDFSALRGLTGRQLDPVPQYELSELFADCERGCVPPVAAAYGLESIVDERLAEPEEIFFEPGARSALIQLRSEDFQRLHESARKAAISLPASGLTACAGGAPGRAALTADCTAELSRAVRQFTPAAEVKRRVQQVYDLPPMPEMAHRILELRADPDANATDLARVVELDPSLAAQVMRYANSPFFGYRGRLQGVQEAISRVLGFDMVMNIALGLASGKTFQNPPDGPLGLNAFWRHATYTAALVQGLVNAMPAKLRPKPGLAYLSGLLHNFGLLLLGHLFQPEFYLLNKLAAANPGTPLVELEKHVLGMGQAQEIIGMGHAMIGAWLMQSWQMPEEIVVALREHHNPDYQGEHAVYSKLVHAANHLLGARGIGDVPHAALPSSVLLELGLDEVLAVAVLEKVLKGCEDLDAMASMLAA